MKRQYVKWKRPYTRETLLALTGFTGGDTDVKRKGDFPRNIQELLNWQRDHSAQILGDITATFQSLGNLFLQRNSFHWLSVMVI